jgi:ketosteroid isomerase-like protein
MIGEGKPKRGFSMNRLHVAPLVAVALLAGLAGCEGAKAPEPFPQAVADAWLGAFNSGDLDGLGLMYTEDAEILPPDQPIVSGHEAIVAFWKSFNPGQVRIEVSAVDSERLGAYWFREGTYAAEFADEGEPRIGKFIELWKKAGGNWLLYRHMWSPNAPRAAEMPATAPAE